MELISDSADPPPPCQTSEATLDSDVPQHFSLRTNAEEVSEPAGPFSDGQASNLDSASEAEDPPSPSGTQTRDASRPATWQASA